MVITSETIKQKKAGRSQHGKSKKALRLMLFGSQLCHSIWQVLLQNLQFSADERTEGNSSIKNCSLILYPKEQT